MQAKHIILGVHITHRLKEALAVQRVLTAHGKCIKTRLGLHEVEADCSAPNGLVLIETVGDEARVRALADALAAIEGVEVKTMTFEHPPLGCEP
jgi:hypothetical protein